MRRKLVGELFYRLLYDSETRLGVVLPITVYDSETCRVVNCFTDCFTTGKLAVLPTVRFRRSSAFDVCTVILDFTTR